MGQHELAPRNILFTDTFRYPADKGLGLIVPFADMRQEDVLQGFAIGRPVLDPYKRLGRGLIVEMLFPGRLIRRFFPRQLRVMIAFEYQAFAIMQHPGHAVGYLARIR